MQRLKGSEYFWNPVYIYEKQHTFILFVHPGSFLPEQFTIRQHTALLELERDFFLFNTFSPKHVHRDFIVTVYTVYTYTFVYITLSKKSRAWAMAAVRFKISKHQSCSVTNPHWRDGVDLAKQSYNEGWVGDYSYLQCTSVKQAGRKTRVGAAKQIGVQRTVDLHNTEEHVERVKQSSNYRGYMISFIR